MSLNKQFVRRVSADRHYRMTWGRLHISTLEKRVVSSDNGIFHRSKHARVWPRPIRWRPKALKRRHSLRTHSELISGSSVQGPWDQEGGFFAEFKGVTLWTERRPLSLTSPITVKESGFPQEASNGPSVGPSLGPWDLRSGKSSRV